MNYQNLKELTIQQVISQAEKATKQGNVTVILFRQPL